MSCCWLVLLPRRGPLASFAAACLSPPLLAPPVWVCVCSQGSCLRRWWWAEGGFVGATGAAAGGQNCTASKTAQKKTLEYCTEGHHLKSRRERGRSSALVHPSGRKGGRANDILNCTINRCHRREQPLFFGANLIPFLDCR